ncbi:ParA family protein [Luteipulveratus flavus]|uniref:ParA family protein n=1 Tax=Luteipulveratus flavus TaxID=3031728 RepID=A0ABT6C6N7_9MICO|nr:ParA family protein [Luteipulveratus sp. YIM 133296]MDF8264601.1 ParA family protein [Luteipulveratus sp. YIM 133296]
MPKTYAFWNNKGGTGKTSLCFQALTFYANQRPDERVLAIDVCPQANLSELLFGGLTGQGSDVLLARQNEPTRRTIGGYFELRMPNPYTAPQIDPHAYIATPAEYNTAIPENIDIIAGDPILELQSNAVSTLANNQIPGTSPWIKVVDWLRDLIESLGEEYDTIFIDANPSFSMYTQIALASADRLVLPVMADDSSRRAIQNAFSLIYGLKLPSAIYTQYAFATKLQAEGRALPKVHVIAKNRLTQYVVSASAYTAVLRSIDADVKTLIAAYPEMFSAKETADVMVEIRDFQTAGVVSFARGCPFYAQKPGRMDVMGKRVRVKGEYLQNCVDSIQQLVDEL